METYDELQELDAIAQSLELSPELEQQLAVDAIRLLPFINELEIPVGTFYMVYYNTFLVRKKEQWVTEFIVVSADRQELAKYWWTHRPPSSASTSEKHQYTVSSKLKAFVSSVSAAKDQIEDEEQLKYIKWLDDQRRVEALRLSLYQGGVLGAEEREKFVDIFNRACRGVVLVTTFGYNKDGFVQPEKFHHAPATPKDAKEILGLITERLGFDVFAKA